MDASYKEYKESFKTHIPGYKGGELDLDMYKTDWWKPVPKIGYK